MAINIDITSEIERADELIDNVSVLLADSYLMGYHNTILEYTNVLSIVKIAREYLNYSQSNTVLQQTVVDAMYVIREYISYKDIKSTIDYFKLFAIEVCSGEVNDTQITPGGHTQDIPEQEVVVNPELKSGKIMDFREYTLAISADGQTDFTMPFSIDDVDKEYITMVVGGDNPKYNAIGIGFHMEGTTLKWHGDYPLRVGYVATVKYVVGTL